MKLLGEPAAPENAGINIFGMIGGAHQKDVVFRLQATDFRKELLHQLNIVLSQIAIGCRQQSVHLIKEDDCRTMFFCASKDSGHALDGIPDSASLNIGRS